MISRQTLIPLFYKDNIELSFYEDYYKGHINLEQRNDIYEKALKIMDSLDAFLAQILVYKSNNYNDLNIDIYNCLLILFKHIDPHNYLLINEKNRYLTYLIRNTRLIKEISFRLIYFLLIRKKDEDLKLMIKLSEIYLSENLNKQIYATG